MEFKKINNAIDKFCLSEKKEAELTISHLNSGYYFVRVVAEERVESAVLNVK